MAPTIPIVFPESFVAGNTLKVKRTYSGYSPSDWTATIYFLQNGNELGNSIASSSGGAHLFNIAASVTSGYQAGPTYYFVNVSKDSEVYTVEEGVIEVKPNPSTIDTLDGRPHCKIVLDNIESYLENPSAIRNQSYTIAGRDLSRYSLDELMNLRDKYRGEYTVYLRKQRLKQGKSPRNIIRTRFR